MKSELKFHGIELPEKLLLMLEEVQALRLLLLKTERKLRELMRSDAFKQKSDLLRTIPGIGPLTAMLILLEIGDVSRFKNFDALNAFVGFCPDSESSGERDLHTGISRRRHNALRSELVESAWTLISKDAAMFDYYKTLTKRMKGHKAIIRVAKKLLRLIRAVLLSERVYVKGVDGNISAEQIAAPQLPPAKPKGRPKKNATAGITA